MCDEQQRVELGFGMLWRHLKETWIVLLNANSDCHGHVDLRECLNAPETRMIPLPLAPIFKY
jgi:hypothetical protein